jgi:hypothetical protein
VGSATARGKVKRWRGKVCSPHRDELETAWAMGKRWWRRSKRWRFSDDELRVARSGGGGGEEGFWGAWSSCRRHVR